MKNNDLTELSIANREQLLKAAKAAKLQRKSSELANISQASEKERAELSFAQKGLWFLAQMEGGSAAYHIAYGLRLTGMLDHLVLRRVLNRIVARHESLRTRFVSVHGRAQQQFAAVDIGCQLHEQDLRGAPDIATTLQTTIEEEAALPFDLQTGPLMRARLLQIGEQEHILLITQHHIVSDGWSMGVMVKELGVLYRAFLDGADDPLPPLSVQYADYAAWQRLAMGDKFQAQAQYWKQALSGAPALLELPSDRPRPAQQNYTGAYLSCRLDATLTAGLKALCQRHGTTLYMSLLAGWALLLARLAAQDEVVIGTPHANRGRSELDAMIGYFVNTLAIRIDLSNSPSVAQLLAQVKALTLAAQQNRDIPFEAVVEQVRPVRSLAYSPIFQVMFAWQNTPQEKLALPNLVLETMPPAASKVAKFDLVLSLEELDGQIVGGIEYSSALFDASTVERYLGYWRTLLTAMFEQDQTSVAHLPLMSASERDQIAITWNATAQEFPRNQCLHEIFEKQAQAYPAVIAVEHGDETLSYAELNARANRLARHLRTQGLQPDNCVAICLERGIDMVVAVLAVLKAGGCYVPLDATNPLERLQAMLADCAPLAVLTELPRFSAVFGDVAAPVVSAQVIDVVHGAAAWQANDIQNLPVSELGLRGEHLAYVIYTSGSTGVPKGVMVTHANITNLINDWQRRFAADLTAGQVAACAWTSFGFDVSLFDLFAPFSYAASLHIVPQAVRVDPELLYQWMVAQRIQMGYLPPFFIRHLAQLDDQHIAALALEQVLVGVEPLPELQLRRLMDILPRLRIVNAYGPTETTVFSSTYTDIRALSRVTPIGYPLANTQIYILDQHRQIVPPGVVGEVYIAGAGVARGYLHRPEMSAERFLRDPFSAAPDARMYRTGDLARYLPDAAIEFIGRNDFQVKLRGFRIELGEIEARLQAHPQVAEAVVIARDVGAGAHLVAYYVTSNPAHNEPVVDSEQLRSYLASGLPDYMVPGMYMPLPALPLSPNGKLDRKALPEPQASAELAENYVAAQGKWEVALAQIWADLLKVERVGRHDNFFALGGHSLLAVQVLSRVRQSFAVDVSLSAIFAQPVLADFAQLLAASEQSTLTAIEPAPESERLALSFAQQRLWFLAQMEGGSAAYHISFGLRLQGSLDVAILQRVLDRIVARHEALRTTFSVQNGQAQQKIAHADIGCALTQLDLRELSPTSLAQHIAQEEHAPFDLQVGPLMRAHLLRTGQDEHVLLLIQHHIISDGWSNDVLINEIAQLYAAFAQQQNDPLPPLAVQYADYAAWQRKDMAAQIAHQATYWKDTLAGAPALLELPSDRARAPKQDYAGAFVPCTLDAQLSAGLRALSQRHGTSLFMTLLASWSILLARLAGQEEVVIGTPSANRGRSELEGMIGFFVNTLALRIDLAATPSVAQLLQQVKAQTLAAQQHQDIPFEQVIEHVRPVRSLAHSPLFQVMFVWQNEALRVPTMPGLQAELLTTDTHSTAKFDLLFVLEEKAGCIEGGMEYATALFDASTIERYLGYWRTLLTAMVADDALTVDRLPLLTQAQSLAVIEDLNATARPYPSELCIHQLFEAQVARSPAAPALLVEQQSLSYAELNERANQLAHYLLQLGVQPDQRVAVCLERGVAMVVALLAVMKAGGAYVPLDPAYPQDRLVYMLADSSPVALLTEQSLLPMVQSLVQQVQQMQPALAQGLAVVDLAADSSSNLSPSQPVPWQACATSNPQVAGLTAQHLAYVIYTSGSTGMPKGVMNAHTGVVNRLLWGQAQFGMTPDERVLQKTPFSFDVSVWEFFWPLSCGAQLVMARPQGHQDPQYLEQIIEQAGITTMHFVPSMLQVFLAQFSQANVSSLRRVMCSGEALPYALQQRFFACMPHVPLHNLYGPTEAAIEVTYWPCDSASHVGIVPIGRPIQNTRIYILDAHGQPVPPGVAGEIHIGGVGVARGYLNRDDLSTERFVPDPFAIVANGRMYKTGDLGRYLPDGAVEYIGRNDFQIKIRGFRIELGEIEARLAAHPGVAEAVVLARDGGGGTVLVAYYSLSSGVEDVNSDSLRADLAAYLPEYMVPAIYVRLDAFPLSANGKLDRKALPEPDLIAENDVPYEAPQGEVEIALAQIWAELLQVEQVGRQDNFFALGGHSLLAVQVLSRLRQSLQLEITLSAVFSNAVLADLARTLQASAAAKVGSNLTNPADLAIGRADEEERLGLSFAQQRLWFLAQMEGASAAYHLPFAVRLTGTLNRAALQQAMERIIDRHESLRTHFALVDGQARQHIAPIGQAFPILEHDVRPNPSDAQGNTAAGIQARLQQYCVQEALRPFDLQAGPLMRASVVRTAEDEHLLLIVQHHIISDGWSIGVMIKELCTLYRAFVSGQADPLPPLPVQYADYAVWQRRAMDEQIQQQAQYWKTALAGAPALLELPSDRPRPVQQDYAGAFMACILDAELTAGVRALSQRHGTTLFMTLFASWACLLARLSGQSEVVIGTPSANRGRRELESMIGFFVNTLAVRVDLSAAPTVAQLLQQVKTQTLAAQQHQDIPFEQVIEHVRPVRSLAHSPLFQAMFIWQNAGAELAQAPEMRFEALELDSIGTAKFDLLFALEEKGTTIQGGVEYATALFDASTIERYLGYWRTLLTAMVADDALTVDRLPLLTQAQSLAVIEDLNATARPYPSELCIHQLFEAQVARSPAAPALLVEQQSLSYAELNERANQLAHYLLQLGVQPDQRVAVCLERGVAMVVALLAVMKAGGAYVPLDPAYPQDRLVYMLADSSPVALLTEQSLLPMVQSLVQQVQQMQPALAQGLAVVDLAADSSSNLSPSQPVPWQACATSNPQVAGLTAQHLAYVIYTSGSTGMPKGVMNAHTGVVNRLLWGQAQFGMTPDERVLQKTPFSFDVSVWEFFWPLSCGAQLVMARPQGHQDPQYLEQIIEQAGITTMHFVPSMLQVFLAQFSQANVSSLRRVMCSGEALPYALQQRFFACMPHVPLHNLYGPTEAAIEVTYWPCDSASHVGIVPIGRPIQNTRIYILDAHGQPVPPGVAGEIHIGGVGVARGYLNRDDLSTERFVPDPFAIVANGRMYKTGDLGRYLPDGAVEYIGRNDFQIKIRGFRIELGEIEARLAAHPGVAEAVVVAHETAAGTQLVAYFSAQRDADQDALRSEKLRSYLGAGLPEYMVPAVLMQVDAFPLSANGKLDRKALPAPELHSSQYQAPEGELETALAHIWSEMLHVEQVGRDDNFFALGGHSLLAIQVLSRVHTVFGVQLALRRLFEAPSIAELAATLQLEVKASASEAIAPVTRSAALRLPLSYAQQRLWFLQKLEGPSATYNMPGAWRLRGVMDVPLLAQSLQQLVARHEVLRSCFVQDDDGEPYVQISQDQAVHLPVSEVREDEVAARLQAHLAQIIDLSRGPLWQAQLLRIAIDEHVLLLNIHHIISDGWSIGILIDEWLSLYEALQQGQVSTLQPLPIQYADYAQWQRSAAHASLLEKQLNYWRAHLAGAPELLNLPIDRPRPAVQRFEGGTAHALVPAQLMRDVHQLSQDSGASLFMTLLSAFALLMSRFSGEQDVLIGTPAVNRDRKELEGLIGLFLNTLVLRTDTSGQPSFRTLLQRVRKEVLDAYENSDVPFERIVDALPLQRDLSRNPLFQVFFNMLNLPVTNVQQAGLQREELSANEVDGLQFDSKFELTLYAQDTPAGLDLHLVYNRSLFDCERMQEMLTQFALLLQQITQAPDASIEDYVLLSDAARAVIPDPQQALGETWYGAVHEMFVARQQAQPQALAIVSHERSWTYQELHEHSERIACYLQAQGVVRGDIVAIYTSRNASLVAGVLGVLKAGAAFMMLDPAYPTDHLAACLEAATPKAWLQVSAAPVPDDKAALVASVPVFLSLTEIDHHPQLLALAGQARQVLEMTAEDLALIAFTSGSTGKPKAVEGRHGPLTHFLPWLQEYFSLGVTDRFSMLSGLAHDPLQRDMFTTFCVGATLHIPHPDVILPERLAEWMQQQAVTVTHLTPAMAQILSEAPAGFALRDLRYVFLVGDVLTRRDVQRLRDLAPTMNVINYYGSTETQRSVSYYEVSRETASQTSREVIPLGRGIPDVQLLVLNAAGNLAGIGEHGEVYVRSAHMARGYRGDPELTAQKFLRNPFGKAASDRMYRTGDLGRYMPNGMVECLGRADTQVKLRGFRIELGHIESLLGQHPAIQEAVVVIRSDAGREKCLVAYILAKNNAQHSSAPSAADLRQFLRVKLPDYMLPTAFVFLDKLPLTPNGKVNRKAFPAPDLAQTETTYIAPRTEQERIMAEIWALVLRLEQVGVMDNFFSLGGHSLLATRLMSLIRQRLGHELPLRLLFEQPTIAGLCASLAAEEASGRVHTAVSIPHADRQQSLLTSFGQQRLWFIDQLAQGSTEYNLPLAFTLVGELNRGAFRQSLQALVERHEVLRTNFVADSAGMPQQVIREGVQVSVLEHDFRAMPAAIQAEMLHKLGQEEAARAFDLARDVMLRAQIFQLAETRYSVLLSRHHIAVDGWSLGILLRELNTLYNAFCEGRDNPLPALSLQYADYAQWQRSQLQGEQLAQQLAYWSEQLSQLPAVHSLPLDKPRPVTQGFHGKTLHRALGSELLTGLQEYCQAQQVTLFMLLHSAFSVLLHRYSNENDIVIGTPIAGRTHSEVEPLIGLFVNNLVLRSDTKGNPLFSELLQRNKQVVLAAYEHQALPFEKLVEQLQPERNLSHSPLFQILLTLHNNERHAMQLHGLDFALQEAPRNNIMFDLELSAGEDEGQLLLNWNYNLDLFVESSIERLASNFAVLLQSIVSQPHARLSELQVLSQAEREHLQVVSSDTSALFAGEPGDYSLANLFAAQVAATPQALAIVDGHTRMTYVELNASANRLAHYLQSQGVGVDSLVGLSVRRSVAMVVGMLAIIKAGAAYVPLDPEYPLARLQYMLSNAGAQVVVTELALLENLPQLGLRNVCLDDATVQQAIATCSANDPAASLQLAEKLAYVIYTSGSTGLPKGVCIQHRALANLLQSMAQKPGLQASDRLLAVTSISFDIAGLELFLPLVQGAQLYIASSEVVRDSDALQALLLEHDITMMQATPATWRLLLDGGWQGKANLMVLCGGEAWPVALNQRLQANIRGVWNVYGPTETTIWSTIEKVAPDASSIVMGGPIANTQLYVLDEALNLVPTGGVGELYIGGAGLARGYWQRDDLTLERFISSPFNAAQKLYRTGDLVRWNAQYKLEYIGRKDYQVKVRGFRIECGEIEAVLLTHPAVKQAAVLVTQRGSGDAFLTAYVLLHSAAPSATLEDDLRLHLAGKLPAYMLPSYFMVLEEFPLTLNGKLDRKALPAPEVQRQASAELIPLHGPREPIIARVWSEVLGIQANIIGAQDSFFNLGGHSLLVLQLINRLQAEFSLRLRIRDVFEHPSVRQQAGLIERLTDAAPASEMPIEKIASPALRKLSFGQEGMLFLSKFKHGNDYEYNMPFAFRLHGNLQVEALQASLNAILQRHEVLRSSFPSLQNEADVQQICIHEQALTLCALHSTEEQLPAHIAENACFDFDLTSGPLVRVSLLRLAEQEYVLLLNIHHIVFDGWSIGILARELSQAYQAYRAGMDSLLPDLSLQYYDYATWQRRRAEEPAYHEHVQYWTEKLRNAPALLDIPLDHPRPAQQDYRGAMARFTINESMTNALKQLAEQCNVTLPMLMLAAFQVQMWQASQQDDLIIGVAAANRARPELEEMIGLFVNTFPIRTFIDGECSFVDFLQTTKEDLLAAFDHQDVPFDQLVEIANPQRSSSYNPLFQVLFVFHNAQQDELSFDGIRIEQILQEVSVSKFDLTMNLQESEGELAVHIAYKTGLFNVLTIEESFNHYQNILSSIVDDSKQSMFDLPLAVVENTQSLNNNGEKTRLLSSDADLINILMGV